MTESNHDSDQPLVSQDSRKSDLSTKKKKNAKTITRGPGRRAQEARRQFLRSVALTVGVTSISLLGFVPLPGEAQRPRLRPPGALTE